MAPGGVRDPSLSTRNLSVHLAGRSCGGGVEASPSESLVGWVREAPVGSCSVCVGVPSLSLSSEAAGVGITLGSWEAEFGQILIVCLKLRPLRSPSPRGPCFIRPPSESGSVLWGRSCVCGLGAGGGHLGGGSGHCTWLLTLNFSGVHLGPSGEVQDVSVLPPGLGQGVGKRLLCTLFQA